VDTEDYPPSPNICYICDILILLRILQIHLRTDLCTVHRSSVYRPRRATENTENTEVQRNISVSAPRLVRGGQRKSASLRSEALDEIP
jgi:hypothetical protein